MRHAVIILAVLGLEHAAQAAECVVTVHADSTISIANCHLYGDKDGKNLVTAGTVLLPDRGVVAETNSRNTFDNLDHR